MNPWTLIVCSSLLALSWSPAFADGDPSDLSGRWGATLKVGAARLRLALDLRRAGDGYRASLDSLDQGARGIAVDRFEVEAGAVRFRIAAIGVSYEGQLSEDGERIEGTFTQGRRFPLTWRRGEPAPPKPPVRPQLPKAPFPYETEEQRWHTAPGAGGGRRLVDEDAEGALRFCGTLTRPRGPGPFPAVVLVTGSGPQDRDETLFGHKPFLVISDALSRAGIAALRYDERGVGQSSGSFARATTLDFADDAANALDHLRRQQGIDPARVGLVGHSEGGIVAALVGAKDPRLAFAVLLAGPGVSGARVLKKQRLLLNRAAGVPEAIRERNEGVSEACVQAVMEEADPAARAARLRRIIDAAIDALSPAERATLGDREAHARRQVQGLMGPWMRCFLRLDPALSLRRVRCPVLALNGGLDLQVDADQNLGAIARALTSGACPSFTLHKLPGLNHMFQTARTGAISEYGLLTETFAPGALRLIGDWIAAQPPRPQPSRSAPRPRLY